MTKKTTLLLACLALLLICALVAPAAAFSGSGSGTTEDPYQITSRAQLEEISSALSASYILMNDIDMGGSATPWTPIGTVSAPFMGTFDGNGHVISNMYTHGAYVCGQFYTVNQYAIGLFAVVSSTEITNLGLENVDFYNTQTGAGGSSVGGIIGYIYGSSADVVVSNSYVSGNLGSAAIQYQSMCGGIVGSAGIMAYAESIDSLDISNCYVDISASILSSNRVPKIGGIVGYVSPSTSSGVTISNCYTLGSLSGTGVVEGAELGTTGGIVGGRGTANILTISVINCVALQSSLTNTQNVDRIAGYAISTNTNNYANSAMSLTGTVSGIHGSDVTESQWETQSWWEANPGWSFASESVWYWNDITSLPNLKIFDTSPKITYITVSNLVVNLESDITLNAGVICNDNTSYVWQYATDNLSYINISSGYLSIDETNISYTTSVTQIGNQYYRLILTSEITSLSSTSQSITILGVQNHLPNTIIKQTTPDITDDTTSQYKIQTQHILPDSPVKLMYLDQYLAYLAVGNAIYKVQSETGTITSISETTGNTIQNAYLGSSNAIITDTDNITAIYDYASGSQTYLIGDATGIIAATTYYAAVKNNSGYLNLYTAAGTYITGTSTTVTQIAANDQTNIIIGHAGTTTLYIWQPSESLITQTTATIPYAITDIKQIIGTNQFIVTTAYKSYIYAITEEGVITTEVTSSATNPLSNTQSTTSDTIIGTNTNNLYIIDNTGTTIGTYTAGSTLNDASIARLTGLWAITGGADTQAYFLTKSSTSSWTLEQTSQIGNPVTHTQISATGTYALVCSGNNLYLFKNTDTSATLYYLNGLVISSSGMPYGNQSITMNGETIKLDTTGKFVTFVTPGTTYTFVADTTTTQYTATNSQLQTIVIQLKPNPYATTITYTAAYNSTSGNIEMVYGDTTGKTESVTWSIYDTVNKTTVYTNTGTVGIETYAVPLEDSYKNYQVTVTADRGDTSVKNSWTITPSGSSPINLYGLDDTGKNIIFGAVLMIFGGLFGVLHSTKGALAVSALAAWMRYMELITVPWILISVAAVIAILASLQKGGEGKP